MKRQDRLTLVLAAISVVMAPGATSRADNLAYVNYWNLTTSGSPIELHLDETHQITHRYLPDEITPSQGVPAGQYSIWLSRPQQQVTTAQMESGEFYTVVLLPQASIVKGIILNDKVARLEPILRLVNLTSKPVQVTIPTLAPVAIKSGEQQDVPVTITNASRVGLVTVNAKSGLSSDQSIQGTFGVGPDHASVLLIHQLGPNIQLTRWQYDQCAVRIATLDYEDACGHSD